MARQKKQVATDDDPGAPEWMVTFSDCMTLLLTFFVLLLSFSSFDNRVFRSLKVVYSTAFTSITPVRRSDRDALEYLPPIRHIVELKKGSEKPTEDQKPDDGLLKETNILDLTTGITFLIPSKKMFWAKGTTLSSDGRRIMDTMTPLLKESPSRIVISENGAVNDQADESFGLSRAWTVMKYLADKQSLDSDRFSISAESTLAKQNLNNGRLDSELTEAERTVEIVLLQRSIYN